MIGLDIDNLLVFVALSLGTLALLAVLIVSSSVRRWRTRCLTLESSVSAMRRELEMLASISLRTGRRIKRIEHEYSGVADRVERVELRSSVPAFDQAIDSARRGTDSNRLTQQYGLSRVEAALVARLHGRKKSA